MIRLVYIKDHRMTSKDFENLNSAYEFAITNLATGKDRTCYENVTGKTFETAVKKICSKRKKEGVMLTILSIGIENICNVLEINS